MSNDTYITLHLPRDDTDKLTLLGSAGWQLKSEVIDWLNENIGTMAPSNKAWYFTPDHEYQWLYGGLGHDRDSKVVRIFYFRTEEQALRFKLVWW